jgi:UrcA family protein
MTTPLRSAGAGLLAFSVTCGLVAALGAQPASASRLTTADPSSRELVVETISTAGLNVSQADHRRRIDSRIRSATRRVCDSRAYSRSVNADQECRRAAQEGAELQLTALVKRAERMAAAGSPTKINTVLTVIAPGSE